MTRKKVSHQQFTRICHYIMAFPDYFEISTIEEATIDINNSFNFEVSETTVRDALKECKIISSVFMQKLKELIH